jgi:hypothetical protein
MRKSTCNGKGNTVTDNSFIADLLGASIAADQSVTNTVIVNAHKNALYWQRAFRDLFDAVDSAAEISTTRQLEGVLIANQHKRDDVARSIPFTQSQINLWKESDNA